ncbi:exodeoxyribonuclease VII small subunit [Thalassotalea aquiviva]|uniref:exodeoxyribonuclease VII small subunit n=1 Tax=Thalassotalea aquiviva TaxID=3242415 RepID=UPI00352A0F73
MTSNKNQNQTFEESINELENIVNDLEHGDLSLEQSMTLFERGLALSSLSQEKLNKAEQKIQILLAKNGEQELQDIDDSELTQS